MSAERVMIIAHGHPDLSKGGAEIAAHQLFCELRSQNVDAVFVARSAEPSHGGSAFSMRNGDREILFHTSMADYFMFRAANPSRVWKDFRHLLERVRPSVVHFHHYLQVGLECLREVRNTLPDARIIVTLHEYLGICAQNGQMIKRETHRLCYRASPDDCSRCMPEYSVADFFLRERYVKAMFADVDAFIAPSHFLAKRYRDWGLPADKITVIENGQPEVVRAPERNLGPGESRGRFAFFGQINPFKGLDVLLEALQFLPEEVEESVHVDVHGSMFFEQPTKFVERITELREDLEDRVTFHGPYEKETLPALMSATDWVVVPSVWWENSPLVIQEAFAYGRPLICSDIGGMAEKVTDGVDGLLFGVGKPRELAARIVRAVEEPDLWEELRSAIRPPVTVRESAGAELAVYRSAGRSVSRPTLSAEAPTERRLSRQGGEVG
jgi:glycosyltransferase involved in cell wall biosynthesis